MQAVLILGSVTIVALVGVAVYMTAKKREERQRADENTKLRSSTPVPPLSPDRAASVRAVMDEAWRDHHHARDQTWRALQIEAVLTAGVLGVDFKVENPDATVAAAALAIVACLFGMFISIHHRLLEVRKITHVFNCEEALELHHPRLISGVKIPGMFGLSDVLLPWRTNTALFIFRMHLALLVFAYLYVVYRVL